MYSTPFISDDGKQMSELLSIIKLHLPYTKGLTGRGFAQDKITEDKINYFWVVEPTSFQMTP